MRLPAALLVALRRELVPLKRALHPDRRWRAGGKDLFVKGPPGQELVLAITGPGPGRAAAGAQALADLFPLAALVSLGFAGALDPGLGTGDLVLAESTIFIGPDLKLQPFPSDAELSEALGAAAAAGGLRLRRGVLATVPDLVATPAMKGKIAERCGAVAVEMEAGAAARVAAERRIPFAAVKAITDLAHETMPTAAMQLVSPRGRARPLVAALHLLRHRTDLPAFLRLRRQTLAAARSLGAFASTLSA